MLKDVPITCVKTGDPGVNGNEYITLGEHDNGHIVINATIKGTAKVKASSWSVLYNNEDDKKGHKHCCKKCMMNKLDHIAKSCPNTEIKQN